MDGLTISEIVPKNNSSRIQEFVTSIQSWSDTNLFSFSDEKYKEIRIDFKRIKSEFSPVLVNDKQSEVVRKVKLFGLTIQSDLKWNTHIDNIISKCLYLLVQLKRANVPARDIIQFYTTCVRPVLEYASNVFNYSLPTYVNDDIERIQKRALSIAHPGFKYEDSLVMSGLSTLRERRNKSCENFFNKIMANPNHKLFNLISISKKIPFYNLRNERTVDVPKFKTERFKNSFLIASSLIVND